jgi:leucyl/phenylalanyl-tRNA--protein transferase
MLQILNDIRVGCWHVLGEPEELEPETMPESEREQVFCNVMNVAGYFEAAFLRDASGDPKPAMIERNLFRPVLLGENIRFPNPEFSDAEGMVAVGGDLKVERLLAAYRQGIFPWTVNPITWWSPDPRGIIELDHLHVSESLARVIRRRTFEVTIDRAFKEVMQACAAPGPNRRSTWITGEFIEAYTLLHQQGHAHSVECWKNGELAGGIYGVSVGGLFAGESMFHLADNASKVALCHLVGHLRERQFLLFDIQMVTAATLLLGAKAIPRSEYLKRLGVAVTKDCPFS